MSDNKVLANKLAFRPFNAETDFYRQNLTSNRRQILRSEVGPALQELNIYGDRTPIYDDFKLNITLWFPWIIHGYKVF